MATSASRGESEESTTTEPTGPRMPPLADPPDAAGTGPDRTEVFRLLSNDRRLRLLAYLDRTDGDRYAFRDLVDHVAARENDKPVAAITGAERNRVYSSMRQVHLPALDDAGVVEFDERGNEVEVAGGFEAVRPYLDEPGPGTEPPWAVGYLLLAGTGTVLAGVAWAAGAGGWAGAAVLPLIALVALVHLGRTGSAGRRLDEGGTAVGE